MQRISVRVEEPPRGSNHGHVIMVQVKGSNKVGVHDDRGKCRSVLAVLSNAKV